METIEPDSQRRVIWRPDYEYEPWEFRSHLLHGFWRNVEDVCKLRRLEIGFRGIDFRTEGGARQVLTFRIHECRPFTLLWYISLFTRLDSLPTKAVGRLKFSIKGSPEFAHLHLWLLRENFRVNGRNYGRVTQNRFPIEDVIKHSSQALQEMGSDFHPLVSPGQVNDLGQLTRLASVFASRHLHFPTGRDGAEMLMLLIDEVRNYHTIGCTPALDEFPTFESLDHAFRYQDAVRRGQWKCD